MKMLKITLQGKTYEVGVEVVDGAAPATAAPAPVQAAPAVAVAVPVAITVSVLASRGMPVLAGVSVAVSPVRIFGPVFPGPKSEHGLSLLGAP